MSHVATHCCHVRHVTSYLDAAKLRTFSHTAKHLDENKAKEGGNRALTRRRPQSDYLRLRPRISIPLPPRPLRRPRRYDGGRACHQEQ